VDRRIAAYKLFWYDPKGPVRVGALSDAICRLFPSGYDSGPQLDCLEEER
jgi:hypothetical protein